MKTFLSEVWGLESDVGLPRRRRGCWIFDVGWWMLGMKTFLSEVWSQKSGVWSLMLGMKTFLSEVSYVRAEVKRQKF